MSKEASNINFILPVFESVYTNLMDLNVLKSFVRAGDEGSHEQHSRATATMFKHPRVFYLSFVVLLELIESELLG